MTEPADDDLVEDITVALIAARHDGQADGVVALRNLRARLELVDPPTDLAKSAIEAAAFRQGHQHAIQACRAEAATVLANLTRTTATTHNPEEHM